MQPCHDIIPEDGAIRALLSTMGFKKTNTGDGIGATLKKIEARFEKKFALGIIDDDKRKPKLFDQYSEIKQESGNLILRSKPTLHHYLIVVQPAIEVWLLENASEANVTASEFGFGNLEQLKRVTKDERECANNQTFKKFLNKIWQAKNPKASGFHTMYDWLTELRDKFSI